MCRSKTAPVLFLACIMILGSCVNLKQPPIKTLFYTLEYDPPGVERSGPLPVAIFLDRFSVAPVYNTNRIIYRDDSYRREAYPYSKWRANPGDLVTYFLARDMRHSGLFKAVFANDLVAPASYRLEGTVDEFLEWDAASGWMAVLAVSVTLMAENEPDISKRILFQKTYRAEEPCRQKRPRSLAEAMSTALAKVSARITGDIYDRLAATGPE